MSVCSQIQPITENILQLALPKKKGKHKTKKGKVKQSTKDWVKNAPKGTTAKDISKLWEQVKDIFDTYATNDNDPLPANTTAPTHKYGLPKKLNLTSLEQQYYNFFHPFVEALDELGDRGVHNNDEGKLPIYAAASPYREYSYFKGGGRLVVDNTSRRRYISLHYSKFYRIS